MLMAGASRNRFALSGLLSETLPFDECNVALSKRRLSEQTRKRSVFSGRDEDGAAGGEHGVTYVQRPTSTIRRCSWQARPEIALLFRDCSVRRCFLVDVTLLHASGVCLSSPENDLCFRDATKTTTHVFPANESAGCVCHTNLDSIRNCLRASLKVFYANLI
jgi:hypothetical protein